MSPRFRAVILVAIVPQFAAAAASQERAVVSQAFSSPHSGVRGAVSSDGRIVAFVSDARLLPDDANAVADIYVLDRATQAVTLEPAPPLVGNEFDGVPRQERGAGRSAIRPVQRLGCRARAVPFCAWGGCARRITVTSAGRMDPMR